MAGPTFEVQGEQERKLADAAQVLKDLCHDVIAATGQETATPRALNTAALSLAIQAVFMADHLGGPQVQKQGTEALLHDYFALGVAVGHCVGAHASPVAMTLARISVDRGLESGLAERIPLTIEGYLKAMKDRKGGKP